MIPVATEGPLSFIPELCQKSQGHISVNNKASTHSSHLRLINIFFSLGSENNNNKVGIMYIALVKKKKKQERKEKKRKYYKR